MSSEKFAEVYAFCDSCRQNILIKLSESILQKRTGGLLSVISAHGNPEHTVLFYLDGNLKIRGCESVLVASAAIESDPSLEPEKSVEKKKKEEGVLEELVAAFESNTKKALAHFSSILLQMMLQNNVYLVDNELAMGNSVANQLGELFSNQGVLPEVVKEGNDRRIQGKSPVVFDLSEKKFIASGFKVETKMVELIIKEVLGQEDSFSNLKYELSKIFYSYNIFRKLLKETDEKYLDTKIAREISIDFRIIPVFLKMISYEGIDTKNRVEYDSLGRAVRSF